MKNTFENKAVLKESKTVKVFRSPEINFNFSKVNGYMEVWGKTKEEDPFYSPYGPLHLDVEISDGDSCAIGCAWCYKGNTGKKAGNSRNMSLETFKQLIAKMPKTICQIAFGITSIDANPDMFPIYDYCREIGIIPNMTISSNDKPSDEVLQRITDTCGAFAISIYGSQPRETRYDLLRRFIKSGAKQLNIHFVVHKNSLETAYEVMSDLVTDPTLKGINAIVFLGLKPKNRGQVFDIVKNDDFTKLVNFCFASGISFGFDSCSARSFDKAVMESDKISDEQKKAYLGMSEPCESSRMSAYFNVEAKYYHCSFGEDMEKGWGIDILDDKVDFIRDIWEHQNAKNWRTELESLNCQCPLFPEIRIENRN